MSRYGVDKPDTRFGLELCDLTDLLRNTEFKVFAGATAEGYSVRGINVKGAAATLTRKEIDKLTDFVKTYRAKGLAFTRFTADGVSSSFEKFLTEDEVKAIHWGGVWSCLLFGVVFGLIIAGVIARAPKPFGKDSNE